MIFSKVAISLLCAFLLFSIFVANLLNVISVDHKFYDEYNYEGHNHTRYLASKYGKPTDNLDNLLWFLQISDIHISIFRDPGRISQFQQFCDNTVNRINPVVVLATGDLTDAKAKDNLGSSQIRTEWIYYHNIVKESGVTQSTIWLDIRGNHDNFNIKTINSTENYFRNYSVQGTTHPKSYLTTVNKNGVSVAFVGIDACPDPGLRRPFNFIGILDIPEQHNILKLMAEASLKSDHVVWFGHYPSSCILSLASKPQSFDLRQLIGSISNSQVYVCGHLHTMGGLVPRMYTKQKKGYLELELSDWKDNRMFRLAAIDHGMFSFVDQKHDHWPLVLVTNPKHARFMMPGREPLNLIEVSTHVRILAFSDVYIESVEISFDKISWAACRRSQNDKPLYVCKWSPHLYKYGLHHLYVLARDENKKEAFVMHPFSLEEVLVDFDITSRMLLMLNAATVFQTLFGILLMANVLPLVVLRFQAKPPKYRRRFGHHVLRRVWLLSKIDKVFYSLVLYALYLPIGPWAVGELIDGYLGVIFAWGILIKGTYLPEPFTYLYGSVQLMFVQIPLIFVLANSLETCLFGNSLTFVKKMIKNVPFAFLLSIQLLLAYFFWLEYGTIAFLFGPLRTWSVVLSSFLWYKTLTLPSDYCRKLRMLNETAS